VRGTRAPSICTPTVSDALTTEREDWLRYAEDARIAGSQCERDYDALRGGK
jgi:hypothetical protein